MFDGIADVFVPVSDLDRAVAWYSSVLGLTEILRDHEHGVAVLGTANQVGLNLVQVRDHAPIEFPVNDFRVSITFNFRSRDIERAHTALRESGARVKEIVESLDGTFRCFDFEDLDGNRMNVVNS